MKNLLVGPVLALVLAVSLVTGCGAEGDPAPSPTGGSSSATPATDATSDAPTDPTSDPTSDATTDPNAATGKLIELEGVSFRLLENYYVVQSTNGRRFEADRRGSIIGDPIQVSIIDSLGLIYPLRKLARRHNAAAPYLTDPAYLAPVTLDGQEWYHLEGKVRSVVWTAAYGFNDADHEIDLSFEFSTRVPLAKRRAFVDSVLATVELT